MAAAAAGLVSALFLGGEQVEQERGQTRPLESVGDKAITRAEATAATAMGKDNHAAAGLGPPQGGRQGDTFGRQSDLA